ncbi:MAG TPA: DinB family protein [Terriglobia bacterium]|nr:DinB family protein [Terriglobia bacterium]
MNKSDVLAKLEYFNMVHGVTLRAISALGDEDLDFRPRPSMRSPKELIFHIYTQEKILADAARLGRFTAEAASRSNPEDKAVAAELKALATAEDLRAYAEACHHQAQSILNAMSEEDLIRPVESPFGTYPVWRYCEFGYDEHWHHRGQLYTYLRLLGKEPPMLYDY